MRTIKYIAIFIVSMFLCMFGAYLGGYTFPSTELKDYYVTSLLVSSGVVYIAIVFKQTSK